MAPGPPNLRSNSFALLADSPPRKRKNNNKTTVTHLFPALPSLPSTDHKYVVVSAINSDKTLAQYSCFAVHRSLLVISKDIITINELRDGNLLLLVKNSSVASKFIASKTLPGICQIEAKYHGNLNLTKGSVYAPFLNLIPEKEIVEELKDVGVVDAYKFQKNIDGKMQPSGVILLSFDRYNIPSSIDIFWRKVEVLQYFPNPMRSKTCQLLGHTAKYCNRAPACVSCNLPPHSPNNCTRTFCANCFGDHVASANSCPKYQQAKEILKIKTVNKCTLREAVKKYKEMNPTSVQTFSSYSAAVSGDSTASLPKTSTNLSNSTVAPGTSLASSKSLITTTDKKTTISKQKTNNNNQTKQNTSSSQIIDSDSDSSPMVNNVSTSHLSNKNSSQIIDNDLDLSASSVCDETNLYTPLPLLNKVLSSSQLSLALSDNMSHSD